MSSEVQLLTLLQAYTRYNQSSLLEYLFLADQKHKEIRDGLSLNISVESLSEKVKVLNGYFEAQFSNVAKQTCDYLRIYFTKDYCSERSEIPLRVAIKVIVNDEIVTLERFPKGLYEDVESQASENSAFEFLVAENQKGYYLCNDIPQAIERGHYKNNRIDIPAARQYIQSEEYQKAQLNLISPEEAGQDWAKCWKKVDMLSGIELSPPKTSCYKSTLVLPISLSSKDLKSTRFREFFYLDEEGASEVNDIIFGYLCLDHPLKNYFREETDVKLADMFADFLSFYMLPQVAYTQYSASYFRAIKAIGEFSKKKQSLGYGVK